MSESEDARIRRTIAFVDRLFGPGMGVRHVRFLERIENRALRDTIHDYHAIEAETAWVSIEENYLLGMCTLCAIRNFDTAAMFAKTLMHLGVAKQRILEVTARLSMWVGGLAAADASFVIQRAIREYEATGLESMAVWFPKESNG